jgi:hypothetical protein
VRRRLRVGEHDAVVTDLDLGDLRHAVLVAVGDFAAGNAPRGSSRCRELHADAAAERLDAAAVPIGSIFGVLKFRCCGRSCSATTIANGYTVDEPRR